jgi:3-phytase/alkaline phosphatase D
MLSRLATVVAVLAVSVPMPAAVSVASAATAPSGVAATRATNNRCDLVLDFRGEAVIAKGTTYAGTPVGGLSGLTYDQQRGVFYAVSDDRSDFAPARFYTLRLHVADGRIAANDVTVTDATLLRRPDGSTFPAGTIDPEDIALTRDGHLIVTSEGDASTLVDPFVREFTLTGRQIEDFPVPTLFLPTADASSGIRNNLAFESAGVTPNGRSLFTGTENALIQDGPLATLDAGSPSRLLQYDIQQARLKSQYVYRTDPVVAAPQPASGFATNGLVDLLPFGSRSLLALERSFSDGVGNSIRIYRVTLAGAQDVSRYDSLAGRTVREADKALVLDLATLGIALDNVEGMAFGPVLPDGRRSLVLVSDDNFSDSQKTQVLLFALDR